MSFAKREGSPPGASITGRLTLWFSLASLGILLGAAGILYWNVARALHDEDARLLVEDVAGLQATYLTSADRQALIQNEIVSEPAIERGEPYFLRLVRPDGDVVETPGMRELLPVAVFGRVTGPVPGVPGRWRSSDGRTFVLHQAPVTPGGTGTRGMFQAAIDVTHDEVLLAGYRRTLLLVVTVGTLLCAVLAWATARHGLRPLSLLAESAREVTAHQLDRRVGPQGWPRELAELTAVFDDMLERLEEAFGRLSRFSADIAHELRTPLANLRGEAEVALNRSRSPAEYRTVLESSLEELESLTGLVDRLLFLARADAGAQQLNREEIDPRDALDQICALYAPLAEEEGVTLEVEPDQGADGEVRESCIILVDPILFRRAVANVVANALAHTPRGGSVSLAARRIGQECRVTVEDSGTGIDEEHLPHVTERFYQADAARAGGAGSVGLGLAITSSIMSLHGGSMRVESEVGRGTRVSLTFPVRAG